MDERLYTRLNAKRQRGLTLIEIMVGAMLLLFAMAGIVPLFLTGLSQASGLRLKSVATNLAREKMEQIRQLDYREIYDEDMRVANPALGDLTLENLFGTSETVRDTTYYIDYAVTESAYGEGKLKEVTVTVTWEAPPPASPARITTLVHQQFLGPRGARLTVTPTSSDPLGTPFPLVGSTTTTVRYYLAQADWGLVFVDPAAASPTPRNIYMRLALFDDTGQSIAFGDPGDEYRIDTSYLTYSRDDEGDLDAVWFEYSFDPTLIPDGYWELRAVAYNQYNEPGNTWRLRLRFEQGAPGAPTDFTATASDDRNVLLTWVAGDERDRSHYVLERRKWDPYAGMWLPWVTIVEQLDPRASTYLDVGDPDTGLDPWGSEALQNVYEYSLWAVDKCVPGLVGPAAVANVAIPPITTTTTLEETTTTTTVPVTTTTTTAPARYSVDIRNQSSSNYDIVITDSASNVVYTGKVNKGKTITVSNLIAGDYLITATANKRPTVYQSFSLPEQAGTVVLVLL